MFNVALTFCRHKKVRGIDPRSLKCNYVLCSSKNSVITTRIDAPSSKTSHWLASTLPIAEGKRVERKARIWFEYECPCNHIQYCGILRLMCYYSLPHRVYTEWQWPLSGVHSIMMEKLGQPGEGGGGGCTPIPFSYIYHHVQSWCTLLQRGQVHSTYFYSTPICTLYCI